jgi:hypothetical protein
MIKIVEKISREAFLKKYSLIIRALICAALLATCSRENSALYSHFTNRVFTIIANDALN